MRIENHAPRSLRDVAPNSTEREPIVTDAQAFAADIVRTICARIRERSSDVHSLVEAEFPLEGWFEAEAFLSCRHRQAEAGYCEVTAFPTYGSENVTGIDGQPSSETGALRVGGSGEPGDHHWFFAEFVILRQGDRTVEDWQSRTEAAAARLLRLGWKRSASVLVVVAACRGNVEADWAGDLKSLHVWQQSPLVEPFQLTLPGGGSLIVKAFDMKRNPADTLTMATSQA